MNMLQRSIIVPIKSHESILIKTITTFVDACAEVSFFAQANEIFNARDLHDELYHHLREQWGLKSQMACNAIRHIAGCYTLKNPNKQYIRRADGIFPTRLAIPLQQGRDWSLLENGQVSLSTLEKRVKVTCIWGSFQKNYILQGWTPTGARLVYGKGRLELHITIEKPAPEELPGEGSLGVDLGQSNLAVVSDGKKINLIIKGGKVKNKQRRFRHLYSSLQANGTRGARNKLRQLQGKQQRWQSQENHIIANQVVALAVKEKKPVIKLENLLGIRSRGKRKTNHQKADFHGWAFAQLSSYITYKAAAYGIDVVLVNPSYTSQECSRCHNIEEGQREKHTFRCKACHLTLHSDLNASRTINVRPRLQGQCSCGPGSFVNEPLSTINDDSVPQEHYV